MKVRFINGERITLTLYAKKQSRKTVEIHPNTLATTLSNLLPKSYFNYAFMPTALDKGHCLQKQPI